MTLCPEFYSARLTAPGAKVADGRPMQDHATARSHPAGVVLAVADGVSRVDGLASHAQVGAYLAAELAAEGALMALRRELGPCDTRGQAAAALHHGLHGLWTELPRERAFRALASTVLLAVVTPTWSTIWCSGDGAFGVIAPASTVISGEDIERHPIGAEFVACVGARHYERHDELAPLTARRGPASAVRDLRTMLFAEGPILGAYVATDGLRHEIELARRLRLPMRVDAVTAQTVLARPPGCDDLAVAWAAERVAGGLGVGVLGGEWT